MPSPAAPLHNILHPVDQSPVIKHAEVTSRSEMERHTPSSAAHGFPAHAPVNTPPAVPSSVAANAAPSLPPSEPSSTVVGDSPTTAPSAAKEVLIAPKTGNEIQIVPPASAEECVPSPLGPFHTCLTCEQVSKNSKKVLHEIRCVRWRMVAVTTYRSGGLNLTRRWEGTTVQDVGDWTEIKTHEIEMKLFYSSHMHRYDLCDIPIKFRVRGFKPVEGDVLTRKWIKRIKLPDGRTVTEKRYIQLPAYALADANATVEIFRQYFETNAINAMLNVAKHSHPIIGRHLEAAVAHCQSLPDGDVEKIFMQKFIKMWFCVRFTTGSDYISGPNKLGCLPVPDSDYPLGDKISVPRMITAQGDSIMQKYTLPEFVGELQFGANIILCYWHYYRTMDPMDDGWDIFCKIIEPPVKPRAEIESAKATMMDTPEYRECFEHPLYFVCQMYMKGWQIRDHYKRGPQDEPQETI
ncbi:hypothetical protein SEUCBS140593_008220 [Sporothrix eucalyptigena]|uniref:Uncharacterized protein n=1 Tax=Sporothrix eucalyptigena TaxID=1812306 RepID=A0ABP0CK30_9PEZI